MGIICDLISVQSQTCWILKQNISFRILGNLKKNFKKLVIYFFTKFAIILNKFNRNYNKL